MFCRKCGKELSDDSKFCNSCGTAVDGEITRTHSIEQKVGAENLDWKSMLMMIGFFFSAIGAFLPCISIKIWWNKKTYTLIDMAGLLSKKSKMSEMMTEFGLEGDIGEIKFVLLLAIVFAGFALIFGIGILVNMSRGVRKEGLIPMGQATSRMGFAYALSMIIFVSLVDEATAEYMSGMEVFSISFWLVLQLVVPFINLGVCVKSVRKHSAVAVKEKICPKCGTRFMFGNECPECGSTLIEK